MYINQRTHNTNSSKGIISLAQTCIKERSYLMYMDQLVCFLGPRVTTQVSDSELLIQVLRPLQLPLWVLRPLQLPLQVLRPLQLLIQVLRSLQLLIQVLVLCLTAPTQAQGNLCTVKYFWQMIYSIQAAITGLACKSSLLSTDWHLSIYSSNGPYLNHKLCVACSCSLELLLLSLLSTSTSCY